MEEVVVEVNVRSAGRPVEAGATLPPPAIKPIAPKSGCQRLHIGASRIAHQFSQLQTAMTNELTAPNGTQEKEPHNHVDGEDDNDEVEEDGPVEATGATGE